MKRFILWLLLSLSLLGGCQSYQAVDVKSVNLSEVKLLSATSARIDFDIEVENPNNVAMSLVFFDGTILKEFKDFATLQLQDTVRVGARSTESVKASVLARIVDPLSLLSSGLNIKSWDLDNIRVTAKFTIETGKGRKKSFRIKEVPVKNIIRHL